MRMITACFARALKGWTSRICVHFLLTFQEVMPISKTRNQLIYKLVWSTSLFCANFKRRARVVQLATSSGTCTYGEVVSRNDDGLEGRMFRLVANGICSRDRHAPLS